MYYPIIDKLKEIMTDITSVKEKEPLVIVGTATSATGGTWTGNYSDINEAFSMNRMVLFKSGVASDVVLVPVVQYSPTVSASSLFSFRVSGKVLTAFGTIFPDNTFNISVIG